MHEVPVMYVGFLSIIEHATHPRTHVYVTHSLASDRRLLQHHVFCVPYYYTQFVSTDAFKLNQFIIQHQSLQLLFRLTKYVTQVICSIIYICVHDILRKI